MCLLAGAASAQDTAADLRERATVVIEECLGSAPVLSNCIGEGAGACMFTDERSAGVSVAPCLEAENAVWEARLAASITALEMDAAEAFAAQIGSRDLRLGRVVATFEAYRDVTCEVEAVLWSGSEGPALTGCRMRVTAEQALRLDAWLEALQ